MRWTKFVVKNFKGICEATLDLEANGSNICTIVGLNESGKTTLLEAIDFFGKDLSANDRLPVDKENSDAFDIIPLPLRKNFNDKIILKGYFILDKSEKSNILKCNVALHDFSSTNQAKNLYCITREHVYQDSDLKTKSNTWTLEVFAKKGKAKSIKKIDHKDDLWQLVVKEISKKLPTISYFPTFAFQIPSKIYLEANKELNEKDRRINNYFLTILQDILDASTPNATLDQHILNRMNDVTEKRSNSITSMEELVYDMSRVVTKEIIGEWNRIFGKKINDKITIKADPSSKSLSFELEGQTKSPINYRSLGFKWFFCFLLFTQFRGKRKDNSKVLFLFDEPASNLHSTAQKRLLNSFQKISQDGCHVIYSTHSHYMINPKWLEHTYIVENEALNIDDKNEESEYQYDASRAISIKVWKYKQFVSKNPTKTTYYQPILDVLDYKPTELELTKKTYFLEGKTDYYAIRYFIDVIFKDDKKLGKLKDINITPSMNGASGMDTLISLYLGWGYDFKIILDSDSKKSGAGKEHQKRYIEEYGLLKERVVCLDDIEVTWMDLRIEELFTESDKLSLQKSEFPESLKYDKNMFHKALITKLGKEETFNFSEKSENNFRTLVSFLLK